MIAALARTDTIPRSPLVVCASLVFNFLSEVPVPTGKIKFYDPERGFGFITGDDGEQVFLHATALPAGIVPLAGAAVEYGVADGRRGPSALSVVLKEQPASVVRAKRLPPTQMATVIEDLVKLLDRTGDALKRGAYPEGRSASQLAAMLRAVADQLEA